MVLSAGWCSGQKERGEFFPPNPISFPFFFPLSNSTAFRACEVLPAKPGGAMNGGFLEVSGLRAASKFCEPLGGDIICIPVVLAGKKKLRGRRGAQLLTSGDMSSAVPV